MKWFVLVAMVVSLLGCEKPEEKPAQPELKVFKGTFLEVLGEATKMVQDECEGAKLYEGDAVVDSPWTTAADVSAWRFVYYVPDGKTAFIEYTDSVFSNITFVDQAWFEDIIIDSVTMDLPEAVELLRKANYDDQFKGLTLRWPLYPGSKEPFYIFGCPKIGFVFVGTVSKSVTVQPF